MLIYKIFVLVTTVLSSNSIYDGEECTECLYDLEKEVCRSSASTMSFCCTEEEITGTCTNDDSTEDENGDTCSDVYDADEELCGQNDNDEFNSTI